MKNKGKYGDKWLKVRTAFLAANPPNHQGYYYCYLCRRPVPANEITVDHIIARSRAQNLRYVFSNLAVACSACNEAKGSKVVKPLDQTYTEDDELKGLW